MIILLSDGRACSTKLARRNTEGTPMKLELVKRIGLAKIACEAFPLPAQPLLRKQDDLLILEGEQHIEYVAVPGRTGFDDEFIPSNPHSSTANDVAAGTLVEAKDGVQSKQEFEFLICH